MAGILTMCAGVICICINDAIAKLLTETYSPLQIVFLRNVIPLPFAVLVTVNTGGAAALCSHRPAVHLLRAVLWLSGSVLYFTSIVHLRLAEATALYFVAPVLITAISGWFLGDHVGWRRWLAVIAGLAGVLIVTHPGSGTGRPAALLALGAAFFSALLFVSARWVPSRESVWTLFLYLIATSALLSGLIVPFAWTALRIEDLWLFLGIAVFGTAGMTLMTQAFRLAPAAMVAPLEYTALLWGTSLGWLIWSEVPDFATLAGATVIILSGVVSLVK
ncbi:MULTISPECIES: DMT family transporter [unclassified Mesorhizobium]|uniref:DMT family transporter n=1 Tax=unclassified Mesorhizobium TaxID=325217 RepID=UPI0003CE0AC9|nr:MULTISPECIES: DMT family transporter [unclassified Mesorhizobium]ESY43061.1 membrane protein [Mesorhizobium sp. LNJC374B00]ESY49060.1 membrane protein [Mesorhizobium sp. LNJC372A00]WJI80986.1 DMT family transporter [Mesorhizobium sp. C374B]WJI87526.1 DMT family transporter [Mesorhizobium sp. C372A]